MTAAPPSPTPTVPVAAGDGLLIPVVLFDGREDTTPRPQRPLSWPKLAAALTRHRDQAQKDGRGWSGVTYQRGARRGNDGVLTVHVLVFDLDHLDRGELPDVQPLEQRGLAYAAATTWSHLVKTDSNPLAGPRWRIVVPLAHPVPAQEWPDLWRRAKCHLCPVADESAKDAARLYYLPARPPDSPPPEAHIQAGRALDPDELPPLPPDLQPRPTPPPHAPGTANGRATGDRPGDAFNARTDWRDLLPGWGWTWCYARGGEDFWRRPQKASGVSATTSYLGTDLLYVFSSSTPFTPRRGYDKLGAYALMEHGGDLTAATKALAARGFGSPLPPRESVSLPYAKNALHAETPRQGGVSASKAFNASPQQTETPWPTPLGEAAFHGLAGRVTRFYAPQSEADPAGLLTGFLLSFGATVGRGPVFHVGATAHHSNEFVLVCGRTAKARKGDGWAPIRRLFSLAQPDGWGSTVLTTGLSTGEGLIHDVRDPTPDDPGATVDKRRLVVEPEFGRVLRVAGREGNTVSATLRHVWDGLSPLKTMTRTRPEVATGAHVSILAHITLKELRALMTVTDAASGFLNRFVHVAVARSKLLPSPQPPDPAQEQTLAAAVTVALESARRVGAMGRTPEAERLWAREYARLASERDGLAGDVLARAEAHVLRLSLVYALLDGARLIDTPHLEAALEVWRFCEQSAAHVYGDASGDSVADAIRKALEPGEPLTRTTVYNLFGRNVPSARIAIAIASLEAAGLARSVTAAEPGQPGRPTTYLVKATPGGEGP